MLPFVFLFICFHKILYHKKTEKVRVFFGLIANNNLVYIRDAMIALGYDAKVIPWIVPANEKGVIDYDLDLSIQFPKLYKNFFGQILLIYAFFFYAACKFDVFIMPFQNRLLDRTVLLSWLEFQLLRILNKKIILNPYGGDIQYSKVWSLKKDKASQELFSARQNDPLYSKMLDNKIFKNTKYCLKYSHQEIVSIDWPDYLPEGRGKHLHMRCFPLQNYKKNGVGHSKIVSQGITIVHATNHSHFKGTKHLEKAVSILNNSGENINLNIIKNKNHDEVLKEILNADLVFDQILLGAYGRLAIEAMALGKPVMCYLREDFIKLYPQWNQCPIINVNIDNLKDKILEFTSLSVEKRQEIGDESKKYIEKFHSPEYVGEKLNSIIQEVISR
ncbi:MAG: glycosyltransferase [Alphaproteobacteria bacterium]|nr:MAG: glycosyltransferase [Alphaproteobacteria bacterium]